MDESEHLSPEQLAQLRARLEEERDELLDQVSELDAEAEMSRWLEGSLDDDPADRGSANIERDRAQGLSNHARALLLQIQDAFQRLEDGSFGSCQRCGDPIPAERLETIPYAQYCLACKQLEERGR